VCIQVKVIDEDGLFNLIRTLPAQANMVNVPKGKGKAAATAAASSPPPPMPSPPPSSASASTTTSQGMSPQYRLCLFSSASAASMLFGVCYHFFLSAGVLISHFPTLFFLLLSCIMFPSDG
jgi:hypothetical protein